ncbi:LacI family DNA-binding transcriptional regulator [Bacillus sp. MRMR6]|uniref:LacI family DNA-binding transcriptional regulator n=1 Tax=Bacillus sp. MRMR6 TaxID=1928617 RepID=UPI000951DEAD|nr:LacI family DNA-binding transcriptional regulator [Bacillus sp. MRMR6]OLS33813.1 transcriptional regulator [Bacillus sp. MRMR6]
MSITIKDIAVAAGVSFSTVSKALNDSPLVKANTKSKILQIAKEMGYEPNFAAQRLVSKQSKTIGLIWPTLERMTPSTLVTKLNEVISQNSYSMILSIDSIKNSVEMFKRFQVDGIIAFEETSVEKINSYSSTIPIVSYGVGGENNYPVIDVGYQEAMFTAVEYLYHLGHRKFSFVGDFSPVDRRQIEKYKGFQKAMDHFGLEIDDQSLINTGGLSWFDGYTSTTRLLSGSRPTAIIGASYDISSGIIRAVREAKLIIPKDISVMGYDNIPQMATLETPLTSVGVPIDVLADKMVNTLLHYIQDKNSVPLIQKVPPTLTERSSCAQTVAM